MYSEKERFEKFISWLGDRVEYVPNEGRFIWLKSRGGKQDGETVGTLNNGYLSYRSSIGEIKIHRLVYYIHNKVLPEIVDHINMNKLDNRIVNLRNVDKSLNQRNQSLRKDNSSGFKGVSLHKRTGKWGVRVSYNGKYKHFGLYDSPLEAARVYDYIVTTLVGVEVFTNFVEIVKEVPEHVSFKIGKLMEGKNDQ